MHTSWPQYDPEMTEPTQSGQYAGQPAPPPQPPAPAPGWQSPPPQQGGPYTSAPLGGPGRPPGPPRDLATVSDRLSGALLVVGAALAIGSSFATLDSSVAYLGDDQDKGELFRTVAKAWSYTNETPGQETIETTQFHGVPLLIGGLLAVVAAVLLLTGSSRRIPLTRGLGVASAALLFGTTLMVVTTAVNDAQWDDDNRTTTFGPGFYMVTFACLLALAATVITLLGTRGPAKTAAGPAQHPQPWPIPPASQPYPPAQPPSSYPQPPSAG